MALHARRWIYPDTAAGAELLRIDPETGVFTARFLRERTARELRRAARQNSWSGLVLLEPVDGSEAALQQAALLLRGTMRLNSDTPARVQGGRLAVLLPATGIDAAASFCQRINRAFSDAGLPAPKLAGAATQDRACSAAALEAAATTALIGESPDASPRVVSV